MKRFALLLLVAFTALSGYAQTTLTLEDAVLNGRKYYPQGLVMPQWVPGTDAYSHVTDGYQSLVWWTQNLAKKPDASPPVKSMKPLKAAERQSRSKHSWNLDVELA